MNYQGSSETPEQRLASARSWAQHAEPVSTSPRGQMTERLQTVIEAAERAAEAIRLDAEDQARRHLAEAQDKADRLTAERVRLISQLTDDLIDHASVVKEHSEKMVGALEEAIRTVTGRLEEVDAAGLEAELRGSESYPPQYQRIPAEAPQPSPPADQREPEPATAASAGAADAEVSAPALLRATQLAVSGGSRESIAAALRSEFGIDPEPVLDRVLG